MDEIGEIIRMRNLLSLTQHELADAAKVKVSRLSYAESGRLQLTHEEVRRLRKALRKASAARLADIVEIVAP